MEVVKVVVVVGLLQEVAAVLLLQEVVEGLLQEVVEGLPLEAVALGKSHRVHVHSNRRGQSGPFPFCMGDHTIGDKLFCFLPVSSCASILVDSLRR